MTRISDPSCRHTPKGRVVAGDPDDAYVSTYVCDRLECIDDAKRWAAAVALEAPRYIPRKHTITGTTAEVTP